MAKDRVIRCKACWHGDCADCTRWTDRQSVCRHQCDVQPNQLALFPVAGTAYVAPPATPTPAAPSRPATRRRT